MQTCIVEASVFVLGAQLRNWCCAAAVWLVEGFQGAVFVAVEGSACIQDVFSAHRAPRVILSCSRGAHSVRHTQEKAVAAWVRDVTVRGLLLYLLRGLGPRLFLLDFHTLGPGVNLEHLAPVGCLVSRHHPALEVQSRSDNMPPWWCKPLHLPWNLHGSRCRGCGNRRRELGCKDVSSTFGYGEHRDHLKWEGMAWLCDLMFRWPYILMHAKERRRRSTRTHKKKSSWPSPERNGVEVTSVQTKKTRYLYLVQCFTASEMISPCSAGSVFQWISGDQSLHCPQYETWLGLDLTWAPYSTPGIRFLSLTEQFRYSVVNSWDEIWDRNNVLKKCPSRDADFQILRCSLDLGCSNGAGTSFLWSGTCDSCILHTCFSRWSGGGWTCGWGSGSMARWV